MELNRLNAIKEAGVYDANVQKELADYMKADQKFFAVARKEAEKTKSDNIGMLTAIEVVDLAIDYQTNPDKYKNVKPSKPVVKSKKEVEKVEPKPLKDIFSIGL